MVNKINWPKKVPNFLGGKFIAPQQGQYFDKYNPATGQIICQAARSTKKDINEAVRLAKIAQPIWAETPPVKRGEVLFELAEAMKQRRQDIATLVSLETGKSLKDSLGETDGAIALARFYAAEGQRLYGRTTTSAVPNKYAMTIREPVGIAGLIIAANTPIANIAWKVFPALICGNAAILKCSEDAPLTAWIFADICFGLPLPVGILSVVHGLGQEAGTALVEHSDVALISFTGSTAVGRYIAKVAGERLAKISLELGGKNALIVCDDADLDNAIKWAVLSAFSNAGQRCAAASRIIVFDSIYDDFRKRFLTAVAHLRVGPTDKDDLGPVINEQAVTTILESIKQAKKAGLDILTGGQHLTGGKYKNGYYIAPAVIEAKNSDNDISQKELFGPVVCLYRAEGFTGAMSMANDSPYGLTGAIHTTNVNWATEFTRKVQTGVAIVNGGTYGSEPHMPFGGVKQSGNGSREPGTEALDIYTNLKDVYQFVLT